MENDLINIDNQKSLFYKSITRSGNNRLIFSAAFGTGKTTFLKRFFKESDQFLAIHLYPINYSVSKNEDIFELIKFDILYELLKHGVLFKKYDVGFVESILYLNSQEQSKALKQFLSFIPKIGKPVVGIFELLQDIFKAINTKRKELEEDEATVAEEFIEGIVQTKGSIYEVDLYSELIINLILRLKTQTQKKIVLVVDDLDRIDPDHIFRILNIFASHVDLENDTENKFDLDKIILSCDIDNIRALFHNKFGQNVNFSGYIDKFYSQDIYRFNNTQEVAAAVNQIMLSIKVENESVAHNYIKNPNYDEFQYIKFILISLVTSNAINLRTLIKLHNRDYEMKIKYYSVGGTKVSNNQVPGILVFEFLMQFFGDVSSISNALERVQFYDNLASEFDIDYDRIINLWKDMILLADININQLKIGDRNSPNQYRISIEQREVVYNVQMFDLQRKRFTVEQTHQSGIKNLPLTIIETRSLVLKAFGSYLSLSKRF